MTVVKHFFYFFSLLGYIYAVAKHVQVTNKGLCLYIHILPSKITKLYCIHILLKIWLLIFLSRSCLDLKPCLFSCLVFVGSLFFWIKVGHIDIKYFRLLNNPIIWSINKYLNKSKFSIVKRGSFPFPIILFLKEAQWHIDMSSVSGSESLQIKPKWN